MDRVQVLKRESASGGGDDADTQPWDEPIEAQEDAVEAAGVFLQDDLNYDENVLISRSGDDMTFKDVTNPVPKTLTNLLAGESEGISEAQHEALDTLTHELTETHDTLVTRDVNSRVNAVLSEDASDTNIRRTEILSRTVSGKVSTYRETQYETDGVTVKRQLDSTIYRLTNGRVDHIETTRTI